MLQLLIMVSSDREDEKGRKKKDFLIEESTVPNGEIPGKGNLKNCRRGENTETADRMQENKRPGERKVTRCPANPQRAMAKVGCW